MAVASTDRLKISSRLSLSSRTEGGHLLLCPAAAEEAQPAVAEALRPDGASRAEADRPVEEAESEVGAGGSFLSRVEAGEALVLVQEVLTNHSRDQPAPHRCNSSNAQAQIMAKDGPAWSDRDSIRATRHPAGVPTHLPPLLHHLNPTPAS